MLCGGQGFGHCRQEQGGTAVAADKNTEGVTYTADKAMDASQLQVDTAKAESGSGLPLSQPGKPLCVPRMGLLSCPLPLPLPCRQVMH